MEEASFTSLWQKPHLKKKKIHTAAALLLQHVEMQCEKGIKPLMHKRKRGENSSDGTGKALIHSYSEQYSHVALWNT